MKKMQILIALVIVIVLLLVWYLFFFVKAPQAKQISWAANFSQMQAEALGLNWKEMYVAMLSDLGVKKIKLLTQWDWVEGKKDDYFFDDIDWQLDQAALQGAEVMYAVGMKTGRWPECHIPGWAENLSKAEQQERILQYIEKVVTRYKDHPAITSWQAENEPLFPFGECPWYDREFLKKEVALIKSLDPIRPVIISDSGEQSIWLVAASIGDKVGVTMYRRLWFHITDTLGFYATFPIPPVVYWYKANIASYFSKKEFFCGELQAEPWAYRTFYDVSLEEQEKTMNLEQFKKNVEYAKATGFNEFYFWGPEWWYWLKEKHNRPEIWNEAKGLFGKSESYINVPFGILHEPIR